MTFPGILQLSEFLFPGSPNEALPKATHFLFQPLPKQPITWLSSLSIWINNNNNFLLLILSWTLWACELVNFLNLKCFSTGQWTFFEELFEKKTWPANLLTSGSFHLVPAGTRLYKVVKVHGHLTDEHGWKDIDSASQASSKSLAVEQSRPPEKFNLEAFHKHPVHFVVTDNQVSLVYAPIIVFSLLISPGHQHYQMPGVPESSPTFTKRSSRYHDSPSLQTPPNDFGCLEELFRKPKEWPCSKVLLNLLLFVKISWLERDGPHIIHMRYMVQPKLTTISCTHCLTGFPRSREHHHSNLNRVSLLSITFVANTLVHCLQQSSLDF